MAKAKSVLVIEDRKDVSKLLEFNLKQEGYTVFKAEDGEAGIKSFTKNSPNFVILDMMLPKKSGTEVCKAIRETSSVPILILSGKGAEVDRVLGLELGADDYMTKPFSVRELLARVKAIMRRPAVKGKEEEVPEAPKPGTIVVGQLEVSFEAFEVKVGGAASPLTSREFDLFRTLFEANGKMFTREQLLDLVWGVEKGADLDVRTVDQHVARLRKKLGVEGARLLTVKNRGYRFKAD